MAFFSGPKRHSYTPSDEENKNQKQAAIVTTTSGKQYSLSKQEMDWIKNRYAQDNADSYGYDVADQQAKAAGQMSAKMLSSYGKSNVDRQLAELGLPSQKNLDKYIGQYQQWNTGGIGKVFGNSLSSQDWSGIGNLYKQSWKYTDSAEDQMRKQKGLMPSALEANYTDTEVDDQLKAGGLPSFKDFNTYLGQYNNQRGIDALYANAAASYTAMRTRQDVNTKEYVKDDNKNYTLVVDPATGRTETKTGRDWYAQSFYDELGRTDKDGNLVYGDIMPLLKPSKTGEESYIDPTKSYIEQMDNLYKAKAKEDKVEFDGHSAFSYDDFAKHYPEYYDAYIKDMPWDDNQTIDARLGVIAREADAQAEKDFYDITDKWFDGDKGIAEFVERYQKDYPPPVPGKNGEPDYKSYYETMFSNMLAHGVSKNIVRKAMKEVRKGFQYDSTNERYEAITDAYANVNKAENKKAREEEQAKLWDYVNYDPNDPASVAAVSGKPVKEEESELSVNDWEKLAKDYIKQAKDEDENDEDTIELARKSVENALAGFFDPDEGIGYTGTVDDVIKVINEIEAQNWNNPAAMRKALEDYGFSKYASYSGLAADLTQNWSDDDKIDLALSLGDTKLIENADKSGEFDKGYKDIFGNAAVTGNENVHPYTKLDSTDFNYALDWAKEQIADGNISEGKAYNILAGLGFQDELEHYIPKQWHEAHYRDVIIPKMFEESGGDVRAMWDGMTEEERAATAQKMVDELSDQQMAEIFSSPTWWKSNPTVYRTFGQAFEQQLAGMVPTFASGMIVDAAVIADAIGAAITDRPAMKDSTNKLLEAQRFAQNYGSVYDGTNGAEVSSFVTDAANEVMKMMVYGNIGGGVGSAISGKVGGTAVGSALSKALSSTKVLKWVPGFFSTMLNSTPFMASSFAGHYAEAKQMGATNAEAAKYGTVMGVAEGALEGANFDYLWGRALGVNKFGEMLTKGAALFKESDVIAAARVANMAASFAGEATEEGLGYFGETLWKMNSRWGRDSTEFSASDMLKEALMGGAIGLLGSAMSVGEINRHSILVDYWANHTSLPSDIVDVATGEKVFKGGTADERAAWENGDTHIMSAGEFAENLYQLDVLNKTEDAKKAQEEHKKRVDEANKKYNAVKAIETNLRAEASALDPSDPEYASKLSDLNSKIRKAAQDSHDASLVREDEITKSENAMDARIEAESRQREAINKAMRDHWAGIYLQNEAEVASRDYVAIRKNWARDRQNGANVTPQEQEEGKKTDVAEQPGLWRSKQADAEGNPTRSFTADDEKQVVETAKKMRYKGNITFVDDPDANWEGKIHLKSGDIEINRAKLTATDTQRLAENPAMWVMEHELFHYMWNRGGNITDELRSTVREMYKKHPGLARGDANANYDKFLDNIMAKRNEQGLTVNDRAAAEEEVIADFFRNYAFRSDAAIKALCQTNGNLGERILSWLRYKIDDMKLRRSKESWARDILNVERQYALALREAGHRPYSDARAKASDASETAYSATSNLTDDILNGYVGQANPDTGVTAEEDEAYMRAALSGDVGTAKRMVDAVARRNIGNHAYHGENRPTGSYNQINWAEFTNDQMFVAPTEEGATNYAQDRFLKPLRYPNEAELLEDYVNSVNKEMGFDYAVERVDGTNWRLVDNKTGEVINPSASAIEIADEVTLASNEANNRDGYNGLPPDIENPFSGGIMELYYFPERVARHRGFNQSYENVLDESVIPPSYIIYDDISLITNMETGKGELVVTNSDGTVTRVPVGTDSTAAKDAFAKVFGPKSNVYDFFSSGCSFDMDDNGNMVSTVKEVPVSPKTQKVFKFENHMFDGKSTDEIGVEDARKGYDVSVVTNILDGGDALGGGTTPGDIAILRNENRIKSADAITYDDDGNIIPLSQRFDFSRNDLRYSGGLDIDQILTDMAESQAQTETDQQWDEKVQEYGAKPQGQEPRARDIRTPERPNAQKRFSDFLRSLVESDKVGNDQVEAIKRKVLDEDWLSYIPVSQRERMEEARAYIAQRQPLEAQQDFHDMVTSGKLGVKTNALGLQLLSDAAARGDIESVLNIATDLQIAATEAGQSAQIFNVLKELKGVGSAWYMNGLIKKLNTKYADRIQAGKMDPITVPVELMEKLSKAVTVDEIAEAESAVAKAIARQLPLTWEARLSNWRYFSMLANPTTHFRNITGNLLMAGLNTAKDTVAAGIEGVAEKAGWIGQEDRAHAWLSGDDKSYWSSFANNSYREQAKNLSGGGKLSFQTFVDQNMRKFDTKWVNALAEFNFKLLEGEDIKFIEPAYKKALMQYMKAQGFTLNEKGEAGKANKKGEWVAMTNAQKTAAVDWASQQAWKATFRDASSLATMLNKLSKENAVSRLLVEGVMPFKKTPINIAKRGFEFSPAGIIMGTVQLATKVRQGKMSAATAIDNLASGITGTALMALGVALAKAGLIRAGGEKDKKLETYLEDTGDQTYAMKFGDKSINMSSIAPATIPLFMGVALNEMIEQSGETIDLSTITDTIAGTLNPFMEMSFMASLNSALKNYNNNGIGGALGNTLLTAAQNYGSQYLPTLGGKIAQFLDPTRRTTKSDATSPIGGNMDYYVRSLAKKVPGLEATLQPDVDIWGRTDTKDSFGDWALDFANKFILPTSVKVSNRDAVDNELIRVVESTGVTDFLPSDGNKYFTVKGERYNMNARQYAQYSQERGQAAYVAIKELMASPAYQAASDETKADMLNKAKEAAYKQVNSLWKEKLGALG